MAATVLQCIKVSGLIIKEQNGVVKTIIYKYFRVTYALLSYSLAALSATFIFSLLYSKVIIGRVLNFGVVDQRNSNHLDFLNMLSILHGFSWLFVMTWPFFAYIIIASAKYRENKFVTIVGSAGLLLILLMYFIDPFGIGKYLDD